MRNTLFAALLAAAPTGPAAAAGSQEGGATSAAFLKLGADARAAGMGTAVSADVSDASAVFWNPAGLAALRYRHATFSHSASYQTTFQDFLAYAQPLEAPRSRNPREGDLRPDQLGSLAVAVLYNNSGSLQEVDNTGVPTGRSFTPQDVAAMLGWGSALGGGVDAGITAKYIYSKISASAETGAVDLGARWRTVVFGTEMGYSLAVVARNVGGALKFHEASDPLPLTVVIGQSLRPLRSLTLTADAIQPRDRSAYASFGAEWRAPMTAGITGALRAGYDGRLKSGDVSGVTGVALGGGLGFERLGFDYAWSPAGELGVTHRLSLSYRF
ncbi:MAG: hypothetical protein A2V88_10840 [Elusimicrobia bacterium RBG_16_66_12]|nr:MAG: hypothetical protein A2V88_10840 [Elusimicrobia bacterium RBG_16_66_12]